MEACCLVSVESLNNCMEEVGQHSGILWNQLSLRAVFFEGWEGVKNLHLYVCGKTQGSVNLQKNLNNWRNYSTGIGSVFLDLQRVEHAFTLVTLFQAVSFLHIQQQQNSPVQFYFCIQSYSFHSCAFAGIGKDSPIKWSSFCLLL